MKKMVFILIVFLIPVLSTVAFGQQTSFQTLNIMDDFWKFWKQAEQVDTPTQVKLFREMVINPHKDIFSGFTGERTDEELIRYVKALPGFVPKMRKITQKLDKELPTQIANFKRAFPDMNWQGTAVFMPNYGQTDSGGGIIGGKHYQLFGVDSIALEYGENADLTVLFSHELFHLYYGQFHSEMNGKNREKGEIPLYWLVWNEGLATYASQRLNPNAGLEQIFLNQQVKTEIAPHLPRLAKKILENFDNGNPDIWRPFMAAEKISDEIPPRSGYYVGYMVARELGRKMSLRRLARYRDKDLRERMKKALKRFATNLPTI